VPDPVPPLSSDRPAAQQATRLQRTRGSLRLAFTADAGRTRLERLYQQGAARARLPAVPTGTPPEAVLINTAGGLTGGDHMRTGVHLHDGAAAVVTTQASEKIYRASDGEVRVENQIVLGGDASLDWLPQETIVFDRARLRRTLTVEAAGTARALLVEALVFGRTAMGESFRAGRVHDAWRVRREGRLVFADGLSADGASGALAHAAALDGGCALATVVLLAPGAEAAVDEVRSVLGSCPPAAGASGWDGLLVVRIAAKDGAALRATLMPTLGALRGQRPLPTVWGC
jgi:urease accessory protein